MKTATRTSLAAAVIVIAACSSDLGIRPKDPAGSLSVTPGLDTVLVGEAVRFYVGDSQPASWTVSDSRVAVIEVQAGWSALVRALHQGTTTVTAAQGDRTASGVLVVVEPGAASRLAFTVLPWNATAAAVLTPAIAVTIEDPSGHPLPSASNAVTVAIGTNPSGATLSGTTTVNAVNGTAVFSDLRIDRPGTGYTLVATSGTLTGATSITFALRLGTRAFIWTAAAGMKDLGVLPGYYTDSYASAINASGQVVGTLDNIIPNSIPIAVAHAFVWDAAHGMRDLGTLPGIGMSSARAINSSGQIVGYAVVGDNSGQCSDCTIAVLWTPSGTMQSLGTLPSDSGFYKRGSVAYGINDAGQAVGYSWHIFAQDTLEYIVERSFIWTQAGGMQPLPDSAAPAPKYAGPPFPWTVAYAVSRSGQVAGMARGVAFRWTTLLGMQALGPLSDSSWSDALAVNDGGDVVGHTYSYSFPDSNYGCDFANNCGITPNVADSSFLWRAAGGAVSLGAVYAKSINTGGQVVGRTRKDVSAVDVRAFVWSAAAGFRDLGTLPNATRSAASAINDAGQIVGWSGP